MLSNTKLYLLAVLFSIFLTSCSKTIEEPALVFSQEVVNIGTTSANLVYKGYLNTSNFDKVGFVIGTVQEISLSNSMELPLVIPDGLSPYSKADNLNPDRQYFFSFFTIKGDMVKIYPSKSFTTHKSNSWVSRARHPLAETLKSSTHGFSIGDKIYLGWGRNNADQHLSSFYVYDPAKDQWNRKGNIPEATQRLMRFDATSLENGKAFIAFMNDNTQENIYYIYDESLDNWSMQNTISNVMYFTPGSNCKLFYHAGKAYQIGNGYSKVNSTEYAFRKIYEFNPVLNSWKEHVSHGYMSMSNPQVVVIDENIYVSSQSDKNEIHKVNLASGGTSHVVTSLPTTSTSLGIKMTRWKDGFIARQDLSFTITT
jgi:hypothetical protein